MELRGNASTDDLLSLENGPHSTVNTVISVESGGQVSYNVTPRESPGQTPTTGRKPKPTLKLNLEDSTWSKSETTRTASLRIRKNLQAGAARVSAVVQRGKTPEFRFRVMLILLFGSIVGLVAFTWYLYERQLLQLIVGDKIQFLQEQRVLHLLQSDGRELLQGTLGQHIPLELMPHDCQVLHPEAGANICKEWKYRARMRVNFQHTGNVSCYAFDWESLSWDTVLRDCYALSDAYWYGMGEISNLTWPFSGVSLDLQEYVTGDLPHTNLGSVLERYWLSSLGVSIQARPDLPLYVSFNSSGDEKLCLESKLTVFPYSMEKKLPKLQYTICTGSDIKTVQTATTPRAQTPLPNITSMTFMESPVWATGPKLGSSLSQDSLQVFANHIMEHGFEAGFILIDTRWQQHGGDLEFDVQNFPNPTEILSILHHKGFKVLLAIHPYICLDSPAFVNGTNEKRFLSDEEFGVPLLTRWRESVCAIIDISDNSSAQWFLSQLDKIKSQYDIDGFVFSGGQSSFLPHSYLYQHAMQNADAFLYKYLTVAAQTGPLVATNVGFNSQDLCALIQLSPRMSTWDSRAGLRSVIPAVLTLGLIGYPLVNPGSVGGDFLPETNGSLSERELPDKELYMRWLQLAAFMPVIQFSVLPGDYDLDVIKSAKVLLKVREDRVLNVMQRSFNEFLQTGAPVLRPLWWLNPEDSDTFTIDSQFAVGNDIIVAPVLEKDKRARDIYLPPGWWRDEIQGQSRRGGKWIYNYAVPLDKVAYFTKTEPPM